VHTRAPEPFVAAGPAPGMERPLAAAVVALCLLTAGCAGVLDGETGRADGPATVTPAPVPDDPPAPIAPGLTRAGVTDADALARAHVARLANVSYTVRHVRIVRTADGGLRLRQVTRAETTAGYRAYTAVRTVSGPNVTEREIRTRWRDGRAVQWTTVDGRTRREIVADGRGIGAPPLPPRDALFFEPTYGERVRSVVAGANVTAVVRPREEIVQSYGAQVYRLRADGASDRTQYPVVPAERVGAVSVTVTVGPTGVVRSYGLQYTVVRNGTRLRVTESLAVSGIGSTTVGDRGFAP